MYRKVYVIVTIITKMLYKLMNIRISGASQQNGDAAREVNRA